jgi:hypothetical protein
LFRHTQWSPLLSACLGLLLLYLCSGSRAICSAQALAFVPMLCLGAAIGGGIVKYDVMQRKERAAAIWEASPERGVRRRRQAMLQTADARDLEFRDEWDLGGCDARKTVADASIEAVAMGCAAGHRHYSADVRADVRQTLA